MENTTQVDIHDSFQGYVVYRYFYQRLIAAVLLCIVSVFGTVGNTLTVIVVGLTKKLQTATNVFVVNLAVADVLTCLVTPWQAVAVLGVDDWPIKGFYWMCVMGAFVLITTLGCSTNNLALIAVNRWVGITKSRLTTRRVYTRSKLAAMVGLSWTVPLCCALIPLLTSFGELGYERLYGSCSWDLSNQYSGYYGILLTTTYYPTQLIIIIMSYTSIFCYVRKTSRSMAHIVHTLSISAKVNRRSNQAGSGLTTRRKIWRRQVDVTKNLVYIVLAFVTSLTPYCVMIYLKTPWSYPLTPWAGIIMACNSCVNPLIYATSHPDFKLAFRHYIRFKKR